MSEMIRNRGGAGLAMFVAVAVVFMTSQLLMHTAISSLPYRASGGSLSAMATAAIKTHEATRDERLKRLKLYDVVRRLHRNPVGERSSKSKSNSTRLRHVFEETHNPNDFQRIQRVVDSLRVATPRSKTPLSTNDIHNCPSDGPPYDYPYHWPMRQILMDWNPNNPAIPALIYQSLCVFDWDTDYATILNYREAEVPFVVQNHPDLMRTAERWMSGQTHLHNNNSNRSTVDNHDGTTSSRNNPSSYLDQLVGDEPNRGEYSDSNHFMFWRKQQTRALRPRNWQPPTKNVELTYEQWYQHAKTARSSMETETDAEMKNHDALLREYYYFRLDAKGNDLHDYLYDELPMFQAIQQDAAASNHKSNVFLVDPDESHGINCRFGMQGLVSEAHFDDERNWIVLLGGQRRYILSHPRQCPNLHLYPYSHPSGRHSSVNWANVASNATILQYAKGTEVVLQASDAMYLPSNYFHFIVSLDISYQCNARSGASHENDEFISSCGLETPE
jgi:Cupin-like domain